MQLLEDEENNSKYYYLVGSIGNRLKNLQDILSGRNSYFIVNLVPFGYGFAFPQSLKLDDDRFHSGTNLWMLQQGISIQLRYFPEYQFFLQVNQKS